jgi:hypothetical protein
MSLLSIELTKDEFNKIIQLAKAAGVYDQFRKGVTLSCNNCGAFVVKASALLTILEHLMNFIDSNDISRSLTDDQQDLYDILCQKREMVVKTVILTDDEWSQYFSHGLSDYQFLCDDKGELITDTEGNPRVLVSTDVVFEFDKQCECRNILSRLT